jgi:GTP diphosphokinase / guanosine-3',5'-bis(diphosphate) 3'-diphosphatase
MVLLQNKLFDHEIIIGSLLHDTMEDTHILTWEDIETIFGSRVCAMVKLVTKEPGLPKEHYLPRLLAGTPDAWVVKLADRVHNLSTLDHCTVEKRRHQIAETRDQILPLCEKLAAEPQYRELGLWFLREISALCAGLERSLPMERAG